jgi:hypothetical protein
MATCYQYLGLSHPDSVRVFVLAASSGSTAPVHGDIVELRLRDANGERGYTALSYVWGENQHTHEVQVGNRQLRVGENLNSALQNLRRRDRPVRLWVDAICINQDDASERNHQVQQMRSVYSSALETVIYLGDSTGGNTGFSAWNFHATWAINEDGDPDYGLPASKEELAYFRGGPSDVDIDVLSRPWFQRLWVFQEAVVSKILSIQCGRRRISWDDFCKIILLSPRYHDGYGFSLKRMVQIELLRDMFQARCAYQSLHTMGHLLPSWWSQVQPQKHNILNILTLLQQTKILQASDPRDKVFGLMGIADGIDEDDPRFAVDYGQDCRNIYARFARNLIDESKSYDILSCIDHSLGRDYALLDNQYKLPSWVPDWNLEQWFNWPLLGTPTILSTLNPEPDMEMAESHFRNFVIGKILMRLFAPGETSSAI